MHNLEMHLYCTSASLVSLQAPTPSIHFRVCWKPSNPTFPSRFTWMHLQIEFRSGQPSTSLNPELLNRYLAKRKIHFKPQISSDLRAEKIWKKCGLLASSATRHLAFDQLIPHRTCKVAGPEHVNKSQVAKNSGKLRCPNLFIGGLNILPHSRNAQLSGITIHLTVDFQAPNLPNLGPASQGCSLRRLPWPIYFDVAFWISGWIVLFANC